MSKHTPGPWGCFNDTVFPADNEDHVIAHILSSSYEIDEFVASDARRIVACVNACSSIPTYQLTVEDGKPTDLGVIIDVLRERRDELLEALRLVLPMAKGYAEDHMVGSNADYCELAAAAIAKAT